MRVAACSRSDSFDDVIAVKNMRAPAGVELPRKLKPGIGAQNNFVAALQMVNEELDKRFGAGLPGPQRSSALR